MSSSLSGLERYEEYIWHTTVADDESFALVAIKWPENIQSFQRIMRIIGFGTY